MWTLDGLSDDVWERVSIQSLWSDMMVSLERACRCRGTECTTMLWHKTEGHDPDERQCLLRRRWRTMNVEEQ